jgi:ornithine cyclodeaminase
VRQGAHLNLIGSYRPERREVDADLVARSVVVVDDLAAARAEAGDLVLAESEGRWSFAHVRGDLVGVCLGEVGRRSDREITVFKSVGLARQDLVVAALAARRAGVLGAA